MAVFEPRNVGEKLKRMLSPDNMEGGLVGREEMDAFGWLYLLVILVLALPLIPLLLVLHVLYSMWQSFDDRFRHPEREAY